VTEIENIVMVGSTPKSRRRENDLKKVILATTTAATLVAFSFSGCAFQPGSSSTRPGSSSGSGSGGPNMQAGQWEFALTPSTGTPFYIEADLVQNGTNLVSATTTTALLLVGSGPIANSFSACFNVSLTSTVGYT
jgi:hypothetical protein